MTAPSAPPDRAPASVPPKPGLAALLAWVGVALAFAYLVFFGGASNFLASPQARILNQLVIVTAAAAWLVVAWRSNDGLASLRTPILLPGLLYGAVVLLSAAASSRPASSLEAAALLLISLPGYLVVRAVLRHPFLRPRVDWLLVLATLGFLVAFLGQVMDQWLAWWGAVGLSVPPLRPANAGLTVGNANAVAVYAELLVAPAAWIAWRRWHSRVVPVVLVALGSATLVITASRGGWLGTAVGAVAVVGWRLIDRRAAGGGGTGGLAGLRGRLLSRGAAAAAVASVVALVVLAGIVAALPALVTRVLAGDAGRTELWTAGVGVWEAHPLLGGGPGSWPGLRPLTDISLASYAVLYTPHSSLVQVLVETGVAGLAAMLLLVAAVARLAWRSIRSAANRAERFERELVAACLLALLVHSLVDPMFHVPGVVLLTLLLVARLEAGDGWARSTQPAASTAPDPLAPPARRCVLVAAVAAPVLFGVALLVPIDGAMLDGQRGIDGLDAGRPADALVAFDRAVTAHDLAPYRVGLGIAKASLGDTAGAIDALRAAAAMEPFTFITAQIAWLQASGDPSAAAASAQETIQSGLYDPAANLNLAVLLARPGRAGSAGDAVGLLASVFHGVPELVYSTRPDALPAGVWEAARVLALAEIRHSSIGHAALLEIRAGLGDLAAGDLSALPDGPERRLLEQVRAAEAGTAPDLTRARADLRADRTNPVAMSAFDRLARLAHSDADVRLVQAISITILTDVPPPDREIRLDGAPGDQLVLGLPRWPNASDSRLGPRRPFVPGMATIQLVAH